MITGSRLYEIKGIQRHTGEHKRRWFFDHEIDLCVWVDEQEQIIGFQLVYDKLADTHALTWWAYKGYSHNRVVDDRWHLPNTLVADGIFDQNRMTAFFKKKAVEVDPKVSEFVFQKLLEYRV